MNTNKSTKQFRMVVALMALAAISTVLGDPNAPSTATMQKSWPRTRASQLIFFAVLEGLYRDGVSNADVDQIIPPGKNGPRFEAEHFVYACPLCHPAFEAFRLYRLREPIYGLKERLDTFGSGLDGEISRNLRDRDANVRRRTIEQLLSRWVGQRLEMMRLSESERAQITQEIEQGRKQGMGGLKQVSGTAQAASTSRTNCPICDGSFGACKLQTR